MLLDGDADAIAREVNFRWGVNVTKYDVEEVINYGFASMFESDEVAAIRAEARERGIAY